MSDDGKMYILLRPDTSLKIHLAKRNYWKIEENTQRNSSLIIIKYY